MPMYSAWIYKCDYCGLKKEYDIALLVDTGERLGDDWFNLNGELIFHTKECLARWLASTEQK